MSSLSPIRRAAVALAVAAWSLALLAPGASHAANWVKAESPHFIVYGVSQQKAREYALMLEDFDTLMRTTYGRKLDEPVARKLDVYLTRDLDELRRVKPDAPSGMLGFYATGDEDIFAVAELESIATQNDKTKGDDVILHEYVHHFMEQYYPSAYPAWIKEGFAEYYATADLGATKLTIGGYNQERANSLFTFWMPIKSVLTLTTEQTPTSLQNYYYAEAWLLTHYILSDEGRSRKLAPYLNAVRAHRDPVVAWQDIYGQDDKALDVALQAYMHQPLVERMLVRNWSPPTVTVTALSPGASAILLENQQAKFLPAGSAAGANCLKILRNADQKYPDDRFVKLARARAENKFGDRAQAEAILEKLITANPNDAEALRQLGMSKLAAGRADQAHRKERFAEATPLLLRAVNLDPENYQGLFHYAESRSLEASYPTDQILDVLLKAVSLAPQLPAVRLVAGQVAIRRGELTIARNMLIPVAGAPHGGDAARMGRGLMAQLDRMEAQAKSAAGPPAIPIPPVAKPAATAETGQ